MSRNLKEFLELKANQKICEVKYNISMYVIMDDDIVPTDGAVTAESLIIRPNYASVVEGVRLANIDPVVTGVSVQVVTK